MKRNRFSVAMAIALLVAGVAWAVYRGTARAQAAGEAGPLRKGLELTVYPQDFGMVREVRPLQLAKGENSLQIQEVSRLMDPRSVLLDWQGRGGAEVIAHSYDLGVSGGQGLLKRYLGKEVEIVRYGDNGMESERQTGRLMVNADGGVVIQDDGKFYVNPPGTIVAPVQKEIVTIPQLTVQAHAPSAGPADLSFTYLTRGLYWSADYVATLDPKTDRMSLECWATVTNRTGADYPDARVALMAGSPNRAVTVARTPMPKYADSNANLLAAESSLAMGGGRPRMLEPEASGEGHQYRIAAPTDVVQEQMNRLLMLSSERVKVKKDYNARLPALYSYWDYYWQGPTPKRGTVTLAISFRNQKNVGLGEPLPNGSMRLYEPDKHGSLRYAGADGIPDTAKDGKVQLTLANAFDLYTERRVIKSEKAGKRKVRREIEVIVHNEKPGDQTVRVVQGFGSNWKMLAESHKHSRTDAYTAQWMIPVKAGAESKLQFTVEMSQ